MNYGLQLYSVRDSAAEDFEGTLKAVAEMGYKMIEPAGFFNLPANEVKAMVDHYGLEVCSTHTGYREVFEHFEDTIAYHKTIGCKNIILPGSMFATKEALTYTIDSINRFQPLIEAEGMKLHYHNHSREFVPNLDGQIAEEEIAKRTNVNLEIDTFWVYNAFLDPIEILEKYKDRITHIHLKDGIRKPTPESSDREADGRSTGMGDAPVLAVRKKAIEMGAKIIIESEGLDPTGLGESKRCIDFLKALDAKEGI